jgi:26S proteasome regulatory subunit N6
LIEITAEIPNTQAIQIELCNDSIRWARETERNFLRHRIESRLASLYLETRRYPEALEIITALLKEVKKVDDKLLLLEIQLTESKIHHAVRNLAKAKVGLTFSLTKRVH